MKRLFLLLIALYLSVHGYAAEDINQFDAHIVASPTTLALNELLTIELDLTYPTTYHPNVAALARNLMMVHGLGAAPFTMTEESIGPIKPIANGLSQQQLTFTLSPQSIGKHFLTFKKIMFEANPPADQPKELISEILEISVTPVNFNFKPTTLIAPLMRLTQQLPISISYQNRQKYFYDPQLAVHEAGRNLEIVKAKTLPLEMLLSACIIAIVLLLLKMLPSKAKSLNQIKPDTTPPNLQALQALNSLEGSNLLGQGQYENYYRGLDAIVRTYIEKSYHVNLSTKTTPEFLTKTTLSFIKEKDKRLKLTAFLENSDRVKFAKYQPTVNECNIALETAKQIIKP